MLGDMKGKSNLKKSMLLILSLLLAIPLLFVPSPSASASSSSKLSLTQFGQPERLIDPIFSNETISIYDGAVGKEDGHDVLYTTTKGMPAIFHVVDLDDYKVLRSFPLEGGSDSWQHEVAPDGSAYVTSGKKLFKYSPLTKQIQEVANFGGEGPWALTTDEAGNAYIGTYPGGNVFKYDAQTGDVTDYGKMIGKISQEYVRSIGYHDGSIYAGTAHAQLVKLDLATRTKVDIAAPLNETGFCYDVNIVDNKYLFARYPDSKKTYIYDLDQQKWLETVLTNSPGLHLADSLDGKVYFIADKMLKTFDIQTHEVQETSMFYGSGLRGADWVEIENDPDLPGKNLVSVTFNGRVAFFNIQTNTVKIYESVIAGAPLPIQVIKKDSAGKLYMSSSASAVGAVYDPAAETNTLFRIGQADGMVEYENKMYMGVYPKAHIYEYDTTLPPGDSNPKLAFQIGEDQDRAGAMIEGGGKVFIGTVSTYGKLGGAVTVFDPKASSNGVKVYRNIVQNQSVVGLAYRNGKLYGSTNINNGLGTAPTETEAKMFVLDVATGTKITEFSPIIEGVSQPKFIGGLSFGSDGLLWGGVNSTIFAMNPDTLQVVKSKQVIGTYPMGAWEVTKLVWSQEGLLYAQFGHNLVVVDPQTMESKFIANTHAFNIGNDGHIYLTGYESQRPTLYRIKVSVADAPPAPAPSSVYNGSFELPLKDGKIPGWTTMFAAVPQSHYYEISNEKSYSGTASLKVTDTVRNGSVALYSDKINVLPGEDYTAKVRMYIEEGTPSLLFRMFDEADKQVAEGLVHVSTNLRNWQEVVTKVTAPTNAKYARVFASSSSYSLSKVYYDDFDISGKFPEQDASAGTLSLIAPSTITKGKEAQVSLKALEANDLYTVEAVVYYDPARFQVGTISLSEQFKNGGQAFFMYHTEVPGKIRIIASQLGDRKLNGDLEIAVIDLKALNVIGDTLVKLDKNSFTAKHDANDTRETYPIGQDLQLTVSIKQIPEDVDGDGKVDIYDLIAVAKRFGHHVDDSNRKFDINGDGKIDIVDIGLVASIYLNE